MHLSPKSKIVAEITGIGKDLSRLVGEFGGTDLHLLPGDSFYDISMGGYSFVKMARDFGLYSGIIGKNIHVNEWLVKKRTPKSYVVEYRRTVVVCETDFGLTYKYCAKLSGYDKCIRRVFPFRRKMQTTHVFKELAEREYAVLLCTSKFQTNGDFYLNFSQINGE